jgi:low affinity Fe/Cu permease
MVLALITLSAGSGVWALLARTEIALTLCLSILAIAITSAILYVGEARDCVAKKRDEAMHAKLDTIIFGVPDADDQVAGIERSS